MQTTNTTDFPDESGSEARRPGDPCIMVIFGASGDLTKRKLIPALYNLAKENLLPSNFALVGFARNEFSTEEFRKILNEDIKLYATSDVDPELWKWFEERIYYMSGDFADPGAANCSETRPNICRQWTLLMNGARVGHRLFLRLPTGSFCDSMWSQKIAPSAHQSRNSIHDDRVLLEADRNIRVKRIPVVFTVGIELGQP